jgi:uncharacterized membrane protein
MAGLLGNFRNTMILSVVLALVMIAALGMHHPGGFDMTFWQAVFRWMHVFFGILWIGLLYYFNFVQIRKMPEIPAELKPAVSKYIAPEALFWFRYSALFTVLSIRGFLGEPGAAPVDPTRIAAQIVSGIGFLGAGAILKDMQDQ